MTIRRKLTVFAAPLALSVAAMLPAQAQDSQPAEAQMAELGEMFANMFTAEPLTPEQEARLPLASELVGKIMPEGFYARMMDETLGSILQPIMSVMPRTMPAAEIAAYLGQPTEQIAALDADQLAMLSDTLDPAYGERMDLGMSYMMGEMVAQMAGLEPYMRDGLSRAYAARFTQAQLEDIAAFFATDTGALYATESMMVFADPQVMSASMQAMPMVMEDMPRIMGEMQELMAAADQPRSFGELSGEERNAIAGMLGIAVPELQESMKAAQQSLSAEEE